ncbi:VRR-NUC domain-containing protein [Paracoccus alcaliphilus]|uniref:VRR-NUC domain-containing protein n=1 Tax=Paracoccus alcaliphilus TaxID=34002 RepID=A0A1H8K317_9RHOB|nr:VRR-NUC domain-containing protein [Paracoccus alcaliphilus]WCR17530.1 VRR-NUC domain-containing protein [Paracoccus alcaliphilus]SEN87439.1 VRR-NUC domain-containing protein [Paracoccus alcaliphilus]
MTRPVRILRPDDGSAPGLRAPKRKRSDVEGPIHKDILAYLRALFPAASIHHSPNSIGLSGKQIQRQIAHNEAMGTRKGYPDIEVIEIGPVVMMFEVKAPGNYPDADQRKLHDHLRSLGCLVAVVRSRKDVDAALSDWGIQK